MVPRPRPSASDNAETPRQTSLYVHFPWCLSKCPYCDFVSYVPDPRDVSDAIPHEAYADAVVREIERRARGASTGSVFFGGGTPSLWEPRAIGRVIDAARSSLALADDVEITIECNPTSLDEGRARALLEAGATRLSIGAQSLRPEQLAFLGRQHDPDGALRAIDAALRVFPRVSADMIFGLPEQSPEDAAEQADRLASRGLRHLSCYQLTIEPGTRFGELAKAGRLPRAEDGLVAESFLAVHERLEARGLRHYEISNYAAPGEESRHNLGYWRGEPYIGVGCAAFGCQDGVRWRNQIDPKKYMQAHDPTMTTEELTPEDRMRERIMLGLRLAEGVDLARAGRELGLDPFPPARERAAAKLIERGRLRRDGAGLWLDPRAWLFADDTAARLF